VFQDLIDNNFRVLAVISVHSRFDLLFDRLGNVRLQCEALLQAQ
jgi:hypothetical protein